MYSQLDLSLIKLFWKKTLEFGCLVQLKEKFKSRYFSIGKDSVLSVVYIDSKYENLFKTPLIRWVLELPNQFKNELEILGHEPHLEDLFRVWEEHWFTFDLINFWTKQPRLSSLIPSKENFNIPYNPSLPLLSQEDSTKEQLINLFSHK